MVEVFSLIARSRYLFIALPAFLVSVAMLAAPRFGFAAEPAPARQAMTPVAVPILMYHEIGDGPNQLYVRLGELERQLRYLAREGYRTVSLSEAVNMLAGKADRGVVAGYKPVVLTFDDGYRSHYTVVFPLLKEMNMTATFFVISGRIGRPGYVSWDELGEMAAAGMEVGCHSARHLDLARVKSESVLGDEIGGARSALRERLGVDVSHFCYPSGKLNDAVVERVKREGYVGAVTTSPGWALPGSDPLRLRRIRVNRSDSLRVFKEKLTPPRTHAISFGGTIR